MEKEQFYKILKDGIINNCVVGNFEIYFDNIVVLICFVGDFKNPKYYSYSIIENEDINIGNDTDDEKCYFDFYNAINDFKVNGKPIAEQIENIKSCGFIEYTKIR